MGQLHLYENGEYFKNHKKKLARAIIRGCMTLANRILYTKSPWANNLDLLGPLFALGRVDTSLFQ